MKKIRIKLKKFSQPIWEILNTIAMETVIYKHIKQIMYVLYSQRIETMCKMEIMSIVKNSQK